MRKKIFIIGLLLASSLNIMATQTEADKLEEQFYNQIKTSKTPIVVSGYKSAKEQTEANFVYNDNSMYTIYCRVNYLTSIFLNPDEELIGTSGGDTTRWSRKETITGTEDGKRILILVKPHTIGVKTNLVISTNKRTYQVQLISDKALYNPIVKWSYPQTEFLNMQEYREREENTTVLPTDLNYNYTINTNKYEFTPLQIFDDGKKTYIVFRENMQELPVFYILEDRKELLITNNRFKKNVMIIDRLFQKAELRIGKKKIRITKER
ncbi:TrbG/VirB9 family P-type conjugative transfer protein [Fusobacterium sp. FSA-380-WT-2B]|uniref:TrbG/VirB9 family P-type conjugative transfer protein n=1 Tax=Fusobacterium sp. FSA-380-WT-2B TaxID=2605786 RepID=UPI0012B43B0F|nr:TrbG/VirB9 family P-type conjugative transfer protein [Fusobacterium sp. FSA-380-WT-2B]MSS62133.1 conjugal transfer protein TrbG [Fusobacterium sp. FSA-380-WT-2B]